MQDGKVSQVEVDMGEPELAPEKIPVLLEGETVIGREVRVGEQTYRITCVSMGNPHCVTMVEEVQGLDLAKIGPAFENHAMFPDRVNTEFIRVLDRKNIEMRVWERGSGETLGPAAPAPALWR